MPRVRLQVGYIPSQAKYNYFTITASFKLASFCCVFTLVTYLLKILHGVIVHLRTRIPPYCTAMYRLKSP